MLKATPIWFPVLILFYIKHDNYILSVDDAAVRVRLEEAVADIH